MISLENFQSINKVIEVKGVEYNVIAYRYDGYGIYVYLILGENGKLEVMVWQDNHEDAKPIFYDLCAIREKKEEGFGGKDPLITDVLATLDWEDRIVERCKKSWLGCRDEDGNLYTVYPEYVDGKIQKDTFIVKRA